MTIKEIIGSGSSAMPPRWDGKILLAGLFILGYYTLVLVLATQKQAASNAQELHDALLVLGPALGVIVGALFRTTGADERANERRSDELKTAIAATPAAVAGATGDGSGTITYTGGAPLASPAPQQAAPAPYSGPSPADIPAPGADVPETPSWPS